MVLLQDATEAYRACVEHHPLVLEAVVALAELGTSVHHQDHMAACLED